MAWKQARWPPLFITFLTSPCTVMTPYQVSSEIYGGFFYSGITLMQHRYRHFSSWMLFSYLKRFKKHLYNKMKLICQDKYLLFPGTIRIHYCVFRNLAWVLFWNKLQVSSGKQDQKFDVRNIWWSHKAGEAVNMSFALQFISCMWLSSIWITAVNRILLVY